MKKSVAIFVWMVMFCIQGFSQQDPIFTQYMTNKMPINPAYTGSTEALSLDLIDRFQWVGIKDGPNTINFTANCNLPNDHLGIGLFSYRDALGPTEETGLMGSFAYRILFPTGKLCFGLQFGFTYLNINWDKLDPETSSDPLLNNQVKQRATPDAGFGLYYYTDRFYVGVSSTHLMENKIVVAKNASSDHTSFSRLMRHFYGMAGTSIPTSDNFLIRPDLLLKYAENSKLQADISCNFLINKVFWIGIGYRTENCLFMMAEVVVAKNLHIGYSFDAWVNQLVSYNKGSHEVRIGFDIDAFKTKRMPETRIF
ncbi:MAG: type IX secretion system membrane protein PorP/SprF [Bacteroidota bacterium]|nr:type IX secretion system membrane protein PorP/SprF [Bacteroidota bacterium]